MSKRLLFYCQPVLGIGHYIRSREIVRALHDFDVCFVNGGEIVQGLEMPPEVAVVNLPALKSDAEFQHLQGSEPAQNLDEVKVQRKEQLVAIYQDFKPAIVVLELFPFGRRKFDFELLPLLAAIQPTTKIVCSLRDILVSKRQQAQFEQEACALMNQYFDLLLIHSDPTFQRLDETFPRVNELTCEVRYTGFVAQPQIGTVPRAVASVSQTHEQSQQPNTLAPARAVLFHQFSSALAAVALVMNCLTVRLMPARC